VQLIISNKLVPIARLTLLALLSFRLIAVAAEEPPLEWVDHDTGHRIIRLSREPGTESLYFNQNAYTPHGDKMVMLTPGGVSTIDLNTRQIDLVVPGIARSTNSVAGVIVGHATDTVYYVRWNGSNNVAYATDLDTHATRKIGILPGGRSGSLSTVNADETWIAGTYVEGNPAGLARAPRNPSISKGEWMQQRFDLHLPMRLFTMDTKTGETRTFCPQTNWLGHIQASPTDPDLLMFCHEGPWHLLDRIWTVHPSSGSDPQLVHKRTMAMEIAGHEFFSWDGKTIWYDLQTPRGEDFWVAGYEPASIHRTWCHLQRDEWSVHFNISPDGTLFAGDGDDAGGVAHALNGKWIYLFRREKVRAPAEASQLDGGNLITPEILRSERLVNMKNHDYRLEPNVNFTPDGKWIIFRSNMFGPTHVFAVVVAKNEK
jgi:oligogalacturonide lyase